MRGRNVHKMWCVITIVALGISISPAYSAEVNWEFSAKHYAPCEGIGINATYSIDVRARIQNIRGGTDITSLSVAVSSAAFGVGSEPRIAATVIINTTGTKKPMIVQLSPAWFDILRAGDSHDVLLYLPPKTTPPSKNTPQRSVFVPSGDTLILSVSPAVITTSGVCPLGTTSKALPLH